MKRGALGLVTLVVCALACAACRGNEVNGYAYALGFPSSEVALATENLKVFVYPAEARCLELVQNTLAGAALPASLAETSSQNLCLYFDPEANGGRIALDPGEYNVLVLGTRGESKYVIGCARQVIQQDTSAVSVDLTLVDPTQSVPASGCTQLSQKCVQGQAC